MEINIVRKDASLELLVGATSSTLRIVKAIESNGMRHCKTLSDLNWFLGDTEEPGIFDAPSMTLCICRVEEVLIERESDAGDFSRRSIVVDNIKLFSGGVIEWRGQSVQSAEGFCTFLSEVVQILVSGHDGNHNCYIRGGRKCLQH